MVRADSLAKNVRSLAQCSHFACGCSSVTTVTSGAKSSPHWRIRASIHFGCGVLHTSLSFALMSESHPTNSKESPEAKSEGGGAKGSSRPRFFSLPSLRFQEQYVWLMFFAGMDVMLTWYILERHGGEEVNPVAKRVIDSWGLWGAIGFKFSLLLFVIIASEWIARESLKVAKFLVWFALTISSFPVLYSTTLLIYHWMNPINP